MKVARLIIYDGSAEWVQHQLGSSLNDGIKKLPNGNIQVITIGITEGMEVFIGANEERKLRRKLDDPTK